MYSITYHIKFSAYLIIDLYNVFSNNYLKESSKNLLRSRWLSGLDIKKTTMKLLYIKRKTTYEKLHSFKMGELTTKVTYVKKYLLGLPIKTLYKYRETYYGEVKDCQDCDLFV